MKVAFTTLGCKTNQYETNAMEQKFKEKGYEISKLDCCDIYIVNTCSVTNMAERKSRQMLRKVKEKNPHAIVVACGCYAQVAKEKIELIPEVDLILGVNEKNDIVKIIEEYLKIKKKVVEVSDVMHKCEFEDFGIVTYTEKTRAVIKIQDGCDRFCTYCIIPYARGRVRSRKPESIIKEIEEISKTGIQEVVLTGIHIASYGKDFNKEQTQKFREAFGYNDEYKSFDEKDDLMSGGFRLIELLEQINKIDNVKRIRLGSIEPKLITDEFINRLSKLDKICDHFHLSLQSGCNETLKRMNRRYKVEEFKKAVELIRNVYPNAMLTTDIIVGFPGETEEEFNKTYEFLGKIKFYKMHIFKYSKRSGTKAENMPNQIPENIKEERSKKLIELSNKNQEEYNKEQIGKELEVLFEEREGGYFKGHTSNYIMVKTKTKENFENQIKRINITKENIL